MLAATFGLGEALPNLAGGLEADGNVGGKCEGWVLGAGGSSSSQDGVPDFVFAADTGGGATGAGAGAGEGALRAYEKSCRGGTAETGFTESQISPGIEPKLLAYLFSRRCSSSNTTWTFLQRPNIRLPNRRIRRANRRNGLVLPRRFLVNRVF